MTTLTKSTGTVTLSGAAEKVTLPAVYGWVWVKNMSDSNIFAGLSADISEGADGVLTIPAGECGRIQTDGQDSVYLLGSGNALVVAQNYADCPFKVGVKGGEIPDLSAYALKSKYGDTTINVGRRVNAPIGEYSTSLGIGTVANGYATTAEGSGSQASELASHAGGYSSQAIKKCSFAHGYEVYANHDYETAFGKHNISNDDTLFSIGNGVEINTDGNISIVRHNAFEITKTGGKLHDKDIATTDLIPAKFNAMSYTITFSEITWERSHGGDGKYYYAPEALNVNKILSVSVGLWSGLMPDEWVLPYIRTDKQFAIFSNVGKTSGTIEIRIVYI